MALRGGFSFIRALERAHPGIAKKMKEKAQSGSKGSWLGGTFGRLSLAAAAFPDKTKTNDLKINKDKPKASLASTVAKKTDEKKENTKQPSLASVVADKKKTKDNKKSFVAAAATKKKAKKPVSPGAAAINV